MGIEKRQNLQSLIGDADLGKSGGSRRGYVGKTFAGGHGADQGNDVDDVMMMMMMMT